MISKGFYFSSKIEKNKGDRDFDETTKGTLHEAYLNRLASYYVLS